VLGSPIGHSLSPVLHRAAYNALGLDWSYDARECTSDGLPAMVSAAAADPAWAGFSLTMPLKLAVLPLLADIEPVAAAVGAVNTVVPAVGGGVAGANTDVPGMVAALREAGVARVSSAAVLGAGGTAQAALAALRELGERSPTVLVRSPARAGALLASAERLGVTPQLRTWSEGVPAGVELVLSTVPAGAADAVELPASCRLLFDVVYAPWPTPLAERARAAAMAIVSGLDLLVHQACGQVRWMTGQEIGPDVLRAALHPF
jgi:shikimate dehydrogenase